MTDQNGWTDPARETTLNALSRTLFGKPFVNLSAHSKVLLGHMADAALIALAPFLAKQIAAAQRAAWMPQENATRNEILEALSREIIKRQQAEDAAALLAAAEPPA